MKTKIKKKKKRWVLCIWALGVMLFGTKQPFALELLMEETVYPEYVYRIGGEIKQLALFVNPLNKTPIFQREADQIFMNPRDYTKHQNESAPYDAVIYNACYLTTSGQKASPENLLSRVAMQVYLYEKYASAMHQDIEFFFDTTQIKEIQNRLLKEGEALFQTTKHSYQVMAGEWSTISLPWNEAYTISKTEDIETRNITTNSFELKIKEPTIQTLPITITAAQETYAYYTAANKASYLEVTKPKTKNPILVIEAKEKKQEYQITVEKDDTITYQGPTKSVSNQKVSFEIKVLPQYVLKKIHVITAKGEEVPLDQNTFIMAEDNIILKVETEKKSYSIESTISHGTIDIPKDARGGEKVSFKVNFDSGYILENIKLETKTHQEIEITNNSFIMPEEEVNLTVTTKKKQYTIQVEEAQGVKIEIDTTQNWGTQVSFKVILDKQYLLKTIKVVTASGKQVEVENNSFPMPEENVLLKVETEKKSYPIKSTISYGTIDIPKKAQAGKEVSFQVNFEEDYVLENIKLETQTHKEIEITNNSFIMPEEEVVLTVTAKKKQYTIKVEEDQGGKIEIIPYQSWGSTVDYIVHLEKKYQIKTIEIKTASGRVLETQENTFVMPKENVIFQIKTQKRKHKIYLYNENNELLIQPFEKSVDEEVQIPFFQEYDEFYITPQVKGKFDTFIMPNADVTIRYKKEREPIENEDKEIEYFPDGIKQDELQNEPNGSTLISKNKEYTYTFENIPNTFQNKIPWLELFAILGISAYVKKRLST